MCLRHSCFSSQIMWLFDDSFVVLFYSIYVLQLQILYYILFHLYFTIYHIHVLRFITFMFYCYRFTISFYYIYVFVTDSLYNLLHSCFNVTDSILVFITSMFLLQILWVSYIGATSLRRTRETLVWGQEVWTETQNRTLTL